MPFRPLFACILWFTDITWSNGTHNISLKKCATFSKGPKLAGVLVHFTKQTFNSKIDVVLTVKSQNAYLSGRILLVKENLVGQNQAYSHT